MSTVKNSIDNWLSVLSSRTNDYSDQIISLFDLSILMEDLFAHQDCPLSGLEVTIKHCSIEYSTNILGELSDNPNERKDPFNSDAEYFIRYELKEKQTASSIWFNSFEKLLISFWLPDHRKHGALDYKQEKLKKLLPELLDSISLKSSQGIYCVFADLDKFGVINKEIGQDAGDKAIQDVLGCFESVAIDERMVCLINGGDEYVFFIESRGDLALLNTLDVIKNKVAIKEYGIDKLQVGITFGICEIEKWVKTAEIDKVINEADQAIKKKNNKGKLEKNRGTVNFSTGSLSLAENIDSDLTYQDFLKLSISLIRCRQSIESPFSNSLLNFISGVTFKYSESSSANFDEYIDYYIKWLGIELTDQHDINEIVGEEHRNQKISKSSLILAISHGYLRSLNSSYLSLKVGDNNSLELLDEDEVIWGDPVKDSFETYDIGKSVSSLASNEALSNCVLIAIGSKQKLFTQAGSPFPENIFADIITLDDRPNSGGGLPDFWQAAIAQLISVIEKNSISKIIVFGETIGTPKIVNLLTKEEDHNIDEIAALTASPRNLTDSFVSLLHKDDVVEFCKSSSEVVNAIYDVISDLKFVEKKKIYSKSNSSIKRVISVPESALPLIHGMRCATAALAYPIVLELLRSDENDEMNTYDNTEKPLKEIIGFKLRLDIPSKDSIPDYWDSSKVELEKYANDVLINPKGLIGRKLTEGNQFTRFINHLSVYCEASQEIKTSTRRAILIVPNQFTDYDLRPLGLVSVWVTPRLQDGLYNLDYCFVWRTVEALVGLPYSLFGSIKFAEHVKKELSKELGEEDVRNSKLKLGKLTYIALSLHMKIDEYNKRIAKSIVDAAST